MPGKPFQVLLMGGKWAVIRQGESVPIGVHDRKRDAVTEATALARFHEVKCVVFDVGGRELPEHEVRDRWS
jgi:hypothetical protein